MERFLLCFKLRVLYTAHEKLSLKVGGHAMIESLDHRYY